MPRSEYAVRTEGLRKRYGKTQAVDGLDLAVPYGMVYGLLGPNGAGKTTAVKILSTLIRRDSGIAEVAGFDVARQARQVRRHIGLTGQHTSVDEAISARQNLVMFGRLFHVGRATARRRADELLQQFGLADVASTPPKKFSGGMRRRLDLASSMILAPEVLFLDEPTTGLDPAGRREVWQAVSDLAAGGTTVLLTTHYLDEADQLCDLIGVIDQGKNLVEDTPEGLKRRIGNERLEIVAAAPDDLPTITALATKAGSDGSDGSEATVDELRLSVSVPVADGVVALTDVATELRSRGVPVADLGLRRPTLDEAFLHLTGVGVTDRTGAGDSAKETTAT